jgi:hypothetical protein
MSLKLYQFLALLFLVGLLGCYPKGPEYTDELDIVYTNYQSTYDFASKKTYAIPDSVIKIDGETLNDPDGDGKPQFMSAASAAAILGQINQNMAANGWTRVDKNANPDVLMLVSSMTTTNIYYYYDWWYWDWWYGGYWGWYYPGYYPPYITGYRSGSVFAQMLDIKNVARGENGTVAWHFIINGLAEGGSADLTARVQKGINQAFSQSPYLKH